MILFHLYSCIWGIIYVYSQMFCNFYLKPIKINYHWSRLGIAMLILQKWSIPLITFLQEFQLAINKNNSRECTVRRILSVVFCKKLFALSSLARSTYISMSVTYFSCHPIATVIPSKATSYITITKAWWK